MKNKRNCMMPYPMYPNVMPGMPISPVNEISSLEQRISNLEQRVSILENNLNQTYQNNYNSSNYQML